MQQPVLSTGRGVRRSRAPAAVPRRLDFPGLAGPVLLKDAGEVERGLMQAIRGWRPVADGPADDPGAQPAGALSSVSRGRDGFRVASPWLDEPLSGLPLASAVCAVIADLAQGYFEQRPGSLALHCGAVRIAGRLVAFTGPARAGKSTLAARLTAEPDMEVFCDDVLPVLPDGRAVALGIAPRLRLPLPRGASDTFRAHAAAHCHLRDDRYGYVTAPTVAPHGTRAPLAALVVLARQAGGPAALHRLDPAEAIRHLLAQNMTDPGADPAVFDRLADLAAGLCCLKLVYSDLEPAVALIRAGFGGADLPARGVPLHPPLPDPGPALVPAPPPVAPDIRWRRSPQVAVRRLGPELNADAVLWRAEDQGCFTLNPVAAAVWVLLDRPASGREVAATLAQAFPQEAPERIAADVLALLGALAAAGLVGRVSDGADAPRARARG